jgi:hypothetical protein
VTKKYHTPVLRSSLAPTYQLNRRFSTLDAALVDVRDGTFEYASRTQAPRTPATGLTLYIKDGQLYQQDSAGTETLLQSVVPSYARLENQQAQNTDDVNIVAGAWTARVLNTIATDPDGIISSLAANQFTLVAGSYVLSAFPPMFQGSVSHYRLYDATNAAEVVRGIGIFAGGSDNQNGHISYQWTIAVPTAYEIQYKAGFAAGALALASNYGTEQYTCVEIWKTA